MVKPKNEYISLKEASEISGYSPDYIGQLIRNGKLPGKQVFQQVVWMTTEDDLRSYMDAKKGTEKGAMRAVKGTINIYKKLNQDLEVPLIATVVLYGIAGFLVALFFALFFVFSSSLDHLLDQNALQRSEQQQVTP